MRLLALLVSAAALATTTSAAVPAQAITKTVWVPLLGCSVTVETNDVFIAVRNREVSYERYGHSAVYSDC